MSRETVSNLDVPYRSSNGIHQTSRQGKFQDQSIQNLRASRLQVDEEAETVVGLPQEV